MPLPKRKHSRARRDKRRSANSKMYAVNLSICTQCKKPKLPHRVCPFCGYYKGKPVVVIKVKEKTKK
ncbi:MAG: 50S ribosomal protein L32 [Candidatus Omnitrophota bacterium]|nr:50S ribosomal protein L32 [Candidatus Omnitrophota bacterium]